MEDAGAGAHIPPGKETDSETAASTAASTCMICGQQKTDGIHILYGFICDSCELEIVRTDVMDDKYPFFVNRMKQLFYKKDA